MMRAHYQNGIESLLGLTDVLRVNGYPSAPRGQATKEIRNAIIEIHDPSDVTLAGIGRNWNAKLAVAEALQLIGGFSDPQKMTEIAPNTAAFLNGGFFNGAYGPRIAPQMQAVIDRLKQDSETRQAIALVWDPMRDLILEENKDRPCTIYFSFAIRNDELTMTTHMRSNDVWWGWSYDLFMFAMLQQTVANATQTHCGSYRHYVDNLHMYERNFDSAEGLNRVADLIRPNLHGIGDDGYQYPWSWYADRAREIFYDKGEPDQDTESEMWMRKMLHG